MISPKNLIIILCILFTYSIIAIADDNNQSDSNTTGRVEIRDGIRFVSIKFKDADIKDVLTGLGELYGVNIISSPDVQGKVTINLTDVSLEECLQYITTSSGYSYKKLDNAYIIEKYKQPEPPQVFSVDVEDDRLTIDAIDIDIGKLLSEIAKKSNRNIIASSAVQGKVTIRIIKVPFEEGLRTMLASNGFTFEKYGEIFSVDKPIMKQGQQSFGFGLLSTTATLMATPIEIKDGLITINLNDIELTELLRVLSEKSKVNIITFGNINDRISVHISNVTFEQALKLILTGTHYSYKKIKQEDLKLQNPFLEKTDEQQDIYIVGDSSQTGTFYSFLVSTEVFPLTYLKAEEATNFLSSVIPQTSIKTLKAQNALSITATSDMLEKARAEISKIDNPPQNIMIEALVLELFDSTAKDLGIDITGSIEYLKAESPGNIIYKSIGGLPKSFSASLQTLIENGKARVLASPKIASISGQQANIDIGQERYYRVGSFQNSQQSGQSTNPYYYPYYDLRTIKAGVMLTITAWAGTDKSVTVTIAPEVSSMTTTGPDALPEVSNRRANSTILLKDGETIVIGGLKQSEESKSVTKTPLLGSIPLIGRLFQKVKTNTRETELTIFITPHVLPKE